MENLGFDKLEYTFIIENIIADNNSDEFEKFIYAPFIYLRYGMANEPVFNYHADYSRTKNKDVFELAHTSKRVIAFTSKGDFGIIR